MISTITCRDVHFGVSKLNILSKIEFKKTTFLHRNHVKQVKLRKYLNRDINEVRDLKYQKHKKAIQTNDLFINTLI